MNDPTPGGGTPPSAAQETCAQCSKTLTPDDRVAAGDRLFCRSCHASLRAELEQAVADMSSDINYVNATIGALIGGAVGVMAWWGFTVLTHIAFGLIAVAIGFLVGYGAVRFAGNKRSGGLQLLSIAVALVGYACANYLVNMTFINKVLAEQSEAFRIGFPPRTIEMFWKVVSADLGVMDLVFLALVVYQAWRIPKPVVLPPAATA